jgi:hypothetical protein
MADQPSNSLENARLLTIESLLENQPQKLLDQAVAGLWVYGQKRARKSEREEERRTPG